MRKKSQSIQVNAMTRESDAGIAIERLSIRTFPHRNDAPSNDFAKGNRSHRHESHSFFVLEKGTVSIEIDFQNYRIRSPSVIYIHPDQVHRTFDFRNVTVSSWTVDNENLQPQYLSLLEDMVPAKPILLNKETFDLFSKAISVCIKFSRRKKENMHHFFLKDSCNALIALVISQYAGQSRIAAKSSRYEEVHKSFRKLLARDFTIARRPAEYAEKLNISVPYLNECVKNVTGYPVSHHIQQRIVLEAKRLLFHTDKSVKEISAKLGFEDYPYFSRLFTKVTGMTALTFRNKNFE